MKNSNNFKTNYYDGLSKQVIANQLDAIIDSSFDGIWICDGEARVIRINKASEKMNQVKAEQVLHRKMQDLVNEGLIDRSVTLGVLKAGTAVTMIQKLKSGKQALVTGNPIFDENGKIILVVVNDRDLSALNSLRSELDKSRLLSKEYSDELSHYHSQNEMLSGLVIKSESMQRVFNTAMKVASVDSIVLIQGESGVGKSLVAGLIHRASRRNDGPFIRVDCSAIPEQLIESELFGYEKGAFTGARTEGKPGRFEIAKGGTLFLDEIGELPASIQVKLLRFIEESEIVPIGGTVSKKIDTRIIAATNRNLDEMVKRGAFREDLFFRLNVIPLKIPPLRERKGAIPYLIHHFLKRFNQKCSTEIKIQPRALDCLCKYSYPGNIRELANLVEQLVVLSPHRLIGKEDLPSHVLEARDKYIPTPSQDGWDLHSAVAKLEKEWITKALNRYGSQRKAADPLGINQSTLARKAKKYGITGNVILHHDAKLQ